MRQATEFLDLHESKVCCDDCETIQHIGVNDKLPRSRLNFMNSLIVGILYSSGFYAIFDVKRKKSGYDMKLSIKKMTPEEKLRSLGDPTTSQDEDPSSSDMD